MDTLIENQDEALAYLDTIRKYLIEYSEEEEIPAGNDNAFELTEEEKAKRLENKKKRAAARRKKRREQQKIPKNQKRLARAT